MDKTVREQDGGLFLFLCSYHFAFYKTSVQIGERTFHHFEFSCANCQPRSRTLNNKESIQLTICVCHGGNIGSDVIFDDVICQTSLKPVTHSSHSCWLFCDWCWWPTGHVYCLTTAIRQYGSTNFIGCMRIFVPANTKK